MFLSVNSLWTDIEFLPLYRIRIRVFAGSDFYTTTGNKSSN